MKAPKFFFFAILTVLSLATVVSAQPVVEGSPVDDGLMSGPLVIDQVRLGPGDQVDLRVFRHDDLNRTVLIPSDGVFVAPLVGEIQATGMEVTELRDEVARRLNRYVVDPEVSISVRASRSRKYLVLGEVNRPGVFSLAQNISIAEAIAQSGGFTPAGATARIVHVRNQPGAEPVTTVVNLNEILKKGDMAQNLQLANGDLLFVPTNRMAKTTRFADQVARWMTATLFGSAVYRQARVGFVLTP